MKSLLPFVALALLGGCSRASGQASSDAGGEDGPPSLQLLALDVSSTAGSGASPPLEMTPPFSPDVFDYYVRCKAGKNALTVSMKAPEGALSGLSQPITSHLASSQTIPLSVEENQAIVAVARAGHASTEYWVRCLPHDFPPIQWAPHPEAGVPSAGYYLVGNSEPPGSVGYAIVLDGHGVPVWYAVHQTAGEDDVDDVVPGAVSFVPTIDAFEIRDFGHSTTTYVAPSGTVLDMHELRLLPNGDFLVLSNPVRTGVDLSGAHAALPDGGVESLGPNSSILDCDVVEFEPNGHVVWTWRGSEHLDPARETVIPTVQAESDGGVIVDAFHCNSIDVDPGNGNLLISARDMDSVVYMDRSTGTVLWKLGGNSYNKDGARYVPLEDAFYGQHDARILTWSTNCGGAGTLTVFDDHSGMPGPARGIVLNVVVGSSAAAGCDVVSPSATIERQYVGTSNSGSRGSFRIGADGSIVIGWGDSDTRGLILSEMDSEGHDLLDVYFTNAEFSYRAVKAPSSAFDLGVLRSNAGLP
jgi:hypothetical protein